MRGTLETNFARNGALCQFRSATRQKLGAVQGAIHRAGAHRLRLCRFLELIENPDPFGAESSCGKKKIHLSRHARQRSGWEPIANLREFSLRSRTAKAIFWQLCSAQTGAGPQFRSPPPTKPGGGFWLDSHTFCVVGRLRIRI